MSDLNLNPIAWPKCGECEVAYVLRRNLSFTEGWLWVWQRDCKHKNAEIDIDQLSAAEMVE